jgi:cobalt-zinc-cadmium efflux system outer membrane protein
LHEISMNLKKTLIAVTLCLGTSLAVAQTEFDLPSLEALAMNSSRSLLASRDQVTAARFAVDSASAFPNPELEYLSGSTRARSPGGNPGDARSVTLTQPIDLPWRRSARIGAAEAGLESAAAGSRMFEADLLS